MPDAVDTKGNTDEVEQEAEETARVHAPYKAYLVDDLDDKLGEEVKVSDDPVTDKSEMVKLITNAAEKLTEGDKTVTIAMVKLMGTVELKPRVGVEVVVK